MQHNVLRTLQHQQHNAYKQKRIVHIEICAHIFMFFLFLCTLTFIFCIENLSFTLFLFHRRRTIVCFLLPLRKKITTRDVLLQVVLAVVVFLRRQVQNQIGTQQQSRIGLGTQNLARHNVHQIGDTRSRSHVHALRERAGTSPFPGDSAPGNSAGKRLMHKPSISIQDCYRGKIRNWIRGKGGGPMSPGIGPLSTLNIKLYKIFCIHNANIFVVIPICVSRSFGLKGTLYISHLLPFTLHITDWLMQNSSREKCAQEFRHSFMIFSLLLSVSVLPSSFRCLSFFLEGDWKCTKDMN